MLQIISIFISIIFIAATFWHDYLAWVYIIIAGIFFHISIFFMKVENKNLHFKEPDALSLEAQILMKKFWHFYNMPSGSLDYSSTCSTFQFVAIIVAGINAYHDIYWPIGLAIVAWFSFAYAAYFYNPLIIISKTEQRYVHEEIVLFLEEKRGAQKNYGSDSKSNDDTHS
jgi:hypothetical protein